MNRKHISPTLIGAFILSALALTVAALLYFGSDRLSGPKLRYIAYFQSDTSGLDPGAPVTLRGVQIGNVAAIRVGYDDHTREFYVRVAMDIDRDAVIWSEAWREHYRQDVYQTYRNMIEQGLRARLQQQSFVTGKLIVQLGFFPDTPLRLHGNEGDSGQTEGLEIPTIPTRMERLLDSLSGVDFGQIAGGIERLVERLGTIADNTDVVALQAQLSSTLGGIERLSRHLDSKVDRLSDSLDQAAGDVSQLARHLDHHTVPLVVDLRNAATAVSSAADTTQSTFAELGVMVARDGKLQWEIDNTLKHLTRAAKSVSTLADYLERHPEALVHGKTR